MKKRRSVRIIPALSCLAALLGCSTISTTAKSVSPGDTIIVGQVSIELRSINLENNTRNEGTTKDVRMNNQVEVTFTNQDSGKPVTFVTEGSDGIFMGRVDTAGETAYRLTKIAFKVDEANTKLTVTVGGLFGVKARMGCANVAGKYVITLAGPKTVNISVEDDSEFLEEYIKTEFPDSALNDMVWSKG
jgi:hypothetical protein